MHDVTDAHRFSSGNRALLRQDQVCGCFCCLKIFRSKEIVQWIPEGTGTAMCPYCGTDAVIGERSGYPITEDFLKKMQRYWF